MSKEIIIDGINNLLEDLNSDVFVTYRDRGVEFGNDRYSSWIGIVRCFLDRHLPGESKRFNQRTYLAMQHNVRELIFYLKIKILLLKLKRLEMV